MFASKTDSTLVTSRPSDLAVLAFHGLRPPAVVDLDASSTASSTSHFQAGISCSFSRQTISTFSTPSLRADRATSMATFPPPMTSTFLPSAGLAAEGNIFEIGNREQDAGAFDAGNVEATGSGKDRWRRGPRRASLQGHRASRPCRLRSSVFTSTPLRNDVVDIFFQNFPGQTIGRDGCGKHAAEHGVLLVERDAVAHVARSRAAVRPEGPEPMMPMLLPFVFCDELAFCPAVVLRLLDGKALEMPDGQRLVDAAAPAGLFAGMVADHGADRRDRVDRGDHFEGLGVFALGDQARHRPARRYARDRPPRHGE